MNPVVYTSMRLVCGCDRLALLEPQSVVARDQKREIDLPATDRALGLVADVSVKLEAH